MAKYPIPEKLRTAFLDAVRKYDDWWGEPEPEVLLAGDLQGTSISSVCALVEIFDDEMPDYLYGELPSLGRRSARTQFVRMRCALPQDFDCW
jgi:hypothetical protein